MGFEAKHVLYGILVVLLIVFIKQGIVETNVLNAFGEQDFYPEAGYCTEYGEEVYYYNINNSMVEYCPVKNFCEISDYAYSDEESDLIAFIELREAEGLYCFKDYTIDKTGQELEFACCNTISFDKRNCEENTCHGKYTGVKDDDECRIYAISVNSDFVEFCGGRN